MRWLLTLLLLLSPDAPKERLQPFSVRLNVCYGQECVYSCQPYVSEQAAVLGSSLLAMVAPSCVGLAQHARLGNVDWRLAAGLAAGTALGSFAGSKVAVNAPTGKRPCPPPPFHPLRS